MSSGARKALLLAGVISFCLGSSRAAWSQWTIPGPEGSNSFIKIGFLAQGQAEWIDKAAASHNVAQNLFIRRFRILMGGQISENLSFFFETDSPNLGKYRGPGDKTADNIYIQDMFMTYSFGDEFKIDGGMILIPLSHNSAQSAATLMAVDYGPYSFTSGAFTQSRVGRDYGVQFRGYLFEKHLEYRAGVYQGNRDLDTRARKARNEDAEQAPFRYAGRIVLHFLDPEEGFFYTGTTLGKKNILSIGGGIDTQGPYHAYGADFFWDQPLGNGDALTVQFDYIYYNGNIDKEKGDPYRTLYSQNDWLGEVGYYHAAAKLGIYGQYAEQNYVVDVDDHFNTPLDRGRARVDPRQDERRYQAGLVYWGLGHNWNIKAGYTVIYREHAYKKPHVYRDQYVVQCQVFYF